MELERTMALLSFGSIATSPVGHLFDAFVLEVGRIISDLQRSVTSL